MNKTVLITGAARGIGAELTNIYLNNGWDVVALDRIDFDESSHAGGTKVYKYLCDLSEESRLKVFENISTNHEVNLVVANAGIGGLNPGYDFSTDLNRKFFEVNFFSVVDLIHVFSRKMKNNKFGQFAIISSLASFRGMPQAASYSSSKSALNKLIESFRVDFLEHGIIFTNVMPGFVETDMTNHSEFSMPFTVNVKKAAQEIKWAIDKKKQNHYFPKIMAFLSYFNLLLPSVIFTFFMGKFVSRPNKEPRSF